VTEEQTDATAVSPAVSDPAAATVTGPNARVEREPYTVSSSEKFSQVHGAGQQQFAWAVSPLVPSKGIVPLLGRIWQQKSFTQCCRLRQNGDEMWASKPC
jgi:hypothetical protein